MCSVFLLPMCPVCTRPTPTPAGDKPPRYIFSFRRRPSVYNSAGFAGGEPASKLIGGHIFELMTRVGIYYRTNDTHETGPPKSEQLPGYAFDRRDDEIGE